MGVKFGTCPVCGGEGILDYKGKYLKWENTLRRLGIDGRTKELLLRLMFNIKRNEKVNDVTD